MIDASAHLVGIGNFELLHALHELCCSLPIMGIGNRAADAPAAVANMAHYPSWGSETGSNDETRDVECNIFGRINCETTTDHRHGKRIGYDHALMIAIGS